jgi:Beta-propeller repeat
MAVVKFASTGAVVCHRTITGTSTTSLDEAQGLELTAAGEPIVSGFKKDADESNDFAYFRIAPVTCDTAWTRTIARLADRIFDMTKDATGNFCVTGRTDSDASAVDNDDVYTAKFNSAGMVLWSITYTSAGIDEGRGSFVKAGISGSVYVTGRTWNGNNFDILLIKYNSAGVQQWVQVYSGGNADDEPSGLVVDASENVCVSGRAEEITPSVYNYVTLKYNSAGVQQWVQQYNGSGAGNDEGEGVAFDLSRNVYVTGSSDRAAGVTEDMDIVTLKYNSAGVLQWAVNVNGPSAGKDLADAIAVNAADRICVTDHTTNGPVLTPHTDATTMLYNNAGLMLWADTYNSPGKGNATPALVQLNGNDFYVAGYTTTATTGRDMLVIKYTGKVSSTPTVLVAPKVMLGGAYVSGTGQMRDDLRVAGLVPLTEPYTALGYTYVGTAGGTTTAAALAVVGSNAIVDWVIVELRNAATPAAIVASRSALVQRDGDVVALDGTSAITFSVANGNYYVALRHRNHLGVMTAASVALGTTTSVVDLSLLSTATFGTGAREDAAGVQVIRSGNVLRDTELKYVGANNDRDPILVNVGGTTPNNVTAGYSGADVNMDGVVKYIGINNDRDPTLVNVGSTAPNSIVSEQLP